MALFGIFLTKKQAWKAWKEEEQTTINAKNRRNKSLELENKVLNEKIAELIDTLKTMNVGTREDKIISLAEKFIPQLLTPKKAEKEGKSKEYTDEEIKTILERVPENLLSDLVKSGEENFIKVAKQRINNITYEQSKRAFIIALERVSNGNIQQDKGETSREERNKSEEEERKTE